MSRMGKELAPLFAFAGQAFAALDAASLLPLAEQLGLDQMVESLNCSSGDLRKEYTRLFLPPGEALCPPLQSAHDGDRRTKGASHVSALAWYWAAGIDPQLGSEAADHAGLLLTFYSRLLETEVPRDQLFEFYKDHLAWVPAFCASVFFQTNHCFYRLLASTTAQLIKDEADSRGWCAA
jgi:TorA maturation chaperone TorD